MGGGINPISAPGEFQNPGRPVSASRGVGFRIRAGPEFASRVRSVSESGRGLTSHPGVGRVHIRLVAGLRNTWGPWLFGFRDCVQGGFHQHHQPGALVPEPGPPVRAPPSPPVRRWWWGVGGGGMIRLLMAPHFRPGASAPQLVRLPDLRTKVCHLGFAWPRSCTASLLHGPAGLGASAPQLVRLPGLRTKVYVV